MIKLEKIKFQFIYNERNEIKLQFYGTYKNGLTQEEIKNYLRARANKLRIENLYKKFCEIAGRNTMVMYKCPCCDYSTSLMYYWDIERFANQLFNGTPTYFD